LILVSLVLSAFAEPEAEGDANHHFVRHWNGALVPQDTPEVVAQKQLHFNAHATAAVHGFKHPNVYGYWPQVPAAVVPKVEVKAEVEQPEVQNVVTHPYVYGHMPFYTIPGLTKPVTKTVQPVVQTAYPYTYGTYPYTYGYTHHMGKREAEAEADADAYYYYNQAYPYSNYYGYNRHFNYGYRYPSTYGFYAHQQPVVTKAVEPVVVTKTVEPVVKPVVQTAYTMPFYNVPRLTTPVTKTVEPVTPVVQTAYTYGTYPYTYGYAHHMGKREAEGDAEADPYYYYNQAYPYSNFYGYNRHFNYGYNRHFNYGYRYPSTYGTYGYPYAYGK
jgi:hypothetical protein